MIVLAVGSMTETIIRASPPLLNSHIWNQNKFWLQHKNTCKTWLLVCITSWDLAICKRKYVVSGPFPSCPFFIARLNRFSSMHGFIIIVFHLHGHAFQACHCRWKLASLNFVSSAHYDIELHLKFLDLTIHTFHRLQQKKRCIVKVLWGSCVVQSACNNLEGEIWKWLQNYYIHMEKFWSLIQKLTILFAY